MNVSRKTTWTGPRLEKKKPARVSIEGSRLTTPTAAGYKYMMSVRFQVSSADPGVLPDPAFVTPGSEYRSRLESPHCTVLGCACYLPGCAIRRMWDSDTSS